MKPKISSLKYTLWLLGRRDYSLKEINDKLRRKEYPADEIRTTINKLTELRFLDDERFCKSFTESQQARGNVGNRLIYLKLLKKGIDKETIKKYQTKANPDALVEAALKWLKKHQNKAKDNIKGRLFQYLAGRGFDYDEIKSVLDSDAVNAKLSSW